MYVAPEMLGEEEVDKARRPKMKHLSVSQRRKNFKEVEIGLTEEMAVQEARRCLRCDLQTEDGKISTGRTK
jgi:hypothetical protein